MGTERVCFRCCLSLVLIGAQALAMQPGAFAQETTAGIQGTVKDAQGGTVPGATVEVTSPALIGKKEVKTDSTGVYRFSLLFSRCHRRGHQPGAHREKRSENRFHRRISVHESSSRRIYTNY